MSVASDSEPHQITSDENPDDQKIKVKFTGVSTTVYFNMKQTQKLGACIKAFAQRANYGDKPDVLRFFFDGKRIHSKTRAHEIGLFNGSEVEVNAGTDGGSKV